MQDYTKYKRGSEWRKWDLHIHTPGTKKNDQFSGNNIEEKWNNYITSINDSVEPISVVGITDYLSIDNYFIFKDKVREGSITKEFNLILPNIELRVLPVTGSATPINLHCIFNPEIDSELENRFFGKFKFSYENSSYSATKAELIRFGRDYLDNQILPEGFALTKGIEQYVVQIDQLRDIFKQDPILRENTIIVVSNKSTDGVSGIIKHSDFFLEDKGSQLDATRRSIYQFADAIFSSNLNDRNYFIGKGPDNLETVIKKCGSTKPCFHGCDAHSNDKIFKPDENRNCWIKADPTFYGLKQVLCEPEDRVKIQALKPDVKNDRFVISELKFIDSSNLFGNQRILLNENLNAVIGGKSSGKSLLLYYIANSIDPNQVSKTSKRLGFDGYEFNSSFNFEVVWKNGEIDILNESDQNRKSRKITYIPQLYINYLAEKNNKDELGQLIINILLQDSEFKSIYENHTSTAKALSSEVNDLLNTYLETRSKLLDLRQKSIELGKSGAISNEIETIKKSIIAGQKASDLTPEEFKQYGELTTLKSSQEKTLEVLNQKENVLSKLIQEVKTSRVNLFGNFVDSENFPLRGQVDRIMDVLNEIPQDVLTIKENLIKNYDLLISTLGKEVQNLDIKTEAARIKKELVTVSNKLKPYLDKIASQKELQQLTKRLEEEKLRLDKATNLEKQIVTLFEEYNNLRKQTARILKKRYDIYADLVNRINTTKDNIGSEIKLQCSLLYKKENFLFVDQVNKAALSRDSLYYSLISDEVVDYNQIIQLYENPLRVTEEQLLIDQLQKIPLKKKVSLEDVLRGLIKDCFSLDFNITYKGDNLLHMSPGKKGTVLLILFLQINSSEYPILIDQPEDNLDNRTIYDLLCRMIKDKKKERQIIIVSHNANLVVATDAENIIGANQSGQDNEIETEKYRFEYVNGSLEHSYLKDTSIQAILYQQGMKEHVCDILEGGNEAFKHRKKKYAIN